MSAPKVSKTPVLPKLSASQVRETFHHLDRNHDGTIKRGELAAPGATTPTGTLLGDSNHDGGLSRTELATLIKQKGNKKAYPDAVYRGRPLEGGAKTFKLGKNESATFRTHPAGLVLGRVNPGEHFVASAVNRNWLYGHVQGHPDRKGWVLRASLPKKPLREGGPAEKAVDLKARSGVEYVGSHDRAVIKYLQESLHIASGSSIGYTTQVTPRDPSRPLQLYSNYPCTSKTELRSHGQPVTVPVGKHVGFRYSPDGKNACVLAYAADGRHFWAYVPMSKLDIPADTIGSAKPPHPILHG